MASSAGQKFVNADWSRLAPTKTASRTPPPPDEHREHEARQDERAREGTYGAFHGHFDLLLASNTISVILAYSFCRSPVGDEGFRRVRCERGPELPSATPRNPSRGWLPRACRVPRAAPRARPQRRDCLPAEHCPKARAEILRGQPFRTPPAGLRGIDSVRRAARSRAPAPRARRSRRTSGARTSSSSTGGTSGRPLHWPSVPRAAGLVDGASNFVHVQLAHLADQLVELRAGTMPGKAPSRTPSRKTTRVGMARISMPPPARARPPCRPSRTRRRGGARPRPRRLGRTLGMVRTTMPRSPAAPRRSSRSLRRSSRSRSRSPCRLLNDREPGRAKRIQALSARKSRTAVLTEV